jgi:hypothetical protein
VRITCSKYYGENFEDYTVNTMEELSKLTVHEGLNWSCGSYTNAHRTLSNFIGADLIGLDIDNDGKEGSYMTLEEAKEIFADYVHVIATSKSHQKEKDGVVTDRFRVILKLSLRIQDSAEFYATWQHLKNKWPAIDNKCKDPSRMWFPGLKVESVSETGKTVDVVLVMPEEKPVPKFSDAVRGKLSSLTYHFILNGAPEGKRHDRLYKASRDMHEQGYTEDEALNVLNPAAIRAYGSNNPDIEKTIRSAFTTESRYERRTHFHFTKLKDIDSTPVKWLVDDFIAEGTVNLFTGKGGLGKSTIVRQLCKCVCDGIPFLGRKTSKSPVLYIASEETKSIVRKQTTEQKLDECDNFYIHIGNSQPIENIDDLTRNVIETEARLLVIDSFSDAVEGAELNSQDAMVAMLKRWRAFASDTGCSIIFIHHINKGDQRNRDVASANQDNIMGSAMIVNKVDMVAMFSGNPEMQARWLSTPKIREGEKISRLKLKYNQKRLWYDIDGSSWG